MQPASFLDLSKERSLHLDMGIPNLAPSDVRLLILRHNEGSLQVKALSSSNWVDLGSGLYLLELSPGDLSERGLSVIHVSPPSSPPKAFPVWTSRGAIPYSDFWVPVFLTSGGSPAGGITPGAITAEVAYGGQRTALSLSSSNFRELLDGGSTTGLYQILLPASFVASEEPLSLRVSGTGIDTFAFIYNVHSGQIWPLYVQIESGVKDGVEVLAVGRETGLLRASAVTDSGGAADLELPAGSYRIVLRKSGYVFSENNVPVEVPPGRKPPTPAVLPLGFEPYSFQTGDTLEVRIDGGAIQEIALPAGSTNALDLAGEINGKLHSAVAYAEWEGDRRRLVIRSLSEGSSSKVEVLSAPPALNASGAVAVGQDGMNQDPYLFLSGEAYVPAVPNPSGVLMKGRLVDASGKPIAGLKVLAAVHGQPPIPVGSDIVVEKAVTAVTDDNGEVEMRLLPGLTVDLIVDGVGILRMGLKVPSTDFTLASVVGGGDIFDVQIPYFPTLPRK